MGYPAVRILARLYLPGSFYAGSINRDREVRARHITFCVLPSD
jgi:hypothetical protein